MFRILYGVVIRAYYFLILLASTFSTKARLWIRGRRETDRCLAENWPVHKKVAWFHCASLGEFEQGRPVIEAFKNKRPDAYILITFFSPSGYEVRKNYMGADSILYLPVDTKRKTKNFISAIQPEWVVFVKYEFWYNLLSELHLRTIPTYLISANFRTSNWFFKWYGRPFLKIISNFNHIFVQNNHSANLLSEHGIHNVTVSGDTRFDRVHQISQSQKKIPEVELFKGDQYLVVAGSTWKEDEEQLIRYINHDTNEVKWIIASHEIHETHLRKLISELKVPFTRFSQFKRDYKHNSRVLIIDNIGLLSSLYGYGDIAYVGGGFGKGIHNILEPATFGLPIIFGPRFQKFQEAVDLLKQGGAFTIHSYEELMNILDSFFHNPESIKECGKHSEQYVKNNLGATKIIVDNLLVL